MEQTSRRRLAGDRADQIWPTSPEPYFKRRTWSAGSHHVLGPPASASDSHSPREVLRTTDLLELILAHTVYLAVVGRAAHANKAWFSVAARLIGWQVLTKRGFQSPHG